jgi:hypothetical protein
VAEAEPDEVAPEPGPEAEAGEAAPEPEPEAGEAVPEPEPEAGEAAAGPQPTAETPEVSVEAATQPVATEPARESEGS